MQRYSKSNEVFSRSTFLVLRYCRYCEHSCKNRRGQRMRFVACAKKQNLRHLFRFTGYT